MCAEYYRSTICRRKTTSLYGTSFGTIYKGSLYRISTAADYGFSGGNSLMADYVVGLDASKSSTVYKNNCSAVRVKSYGVYMWCRTA